MPKNSAEITVVSIYTITAFLPSNCLTTAIVAKFVAGPAIKKCKCRARRST
jgi:hypothetical protein